MLGIVFINKRNPMDYGIIEGSSPKRLPTRERGPVSSNLNTQDIVGSQAGTRGMGAFVQRQRENPKDHISVQDIKGTQPGSIKNGKVILKVGPLSKRITNPITPDYQALGHTQKDLRQDVVSAEAWKEQTIK